MKIFQNINEFPVSNDFVVLTLGMYDGVHLGHQKILKDIICKAKEKNGKSVLLTFTPHPRKVLQEGVSLKMLSLQEEKLRLLEKIGLDYVIEHPFTKEFSRLHSTDFVRDLLVNTIGINELVIGHDHHFGRNREGSFENLEELADVYDFKLREIEAQNLSEITISSTKIRNALLNGEIKIANKYLNYQYSVKGEVVHGDKIGRTINFPTANLKVDKEKLIPKNGVYLIRSIFNLKSYYGLVNIGVRPTLTNPEERIEVFLFDFDQDIYGETLEIHFIEKIRGEQKFDSIKALKKQIELDYQKSLEILN